MTIIFFKKIILGKVVGFWSLLIENLIKYAYVEQALQYFWPSSSASGKRISKVLEGGKSLQKPTRR
jgi:hypothetical protein